MTVVWRGDGIQRRSKYRSALREIKRNQYRYPNQLAQIAEHRTPESASALAHKLRKEYPEFYFESHKTDEGTGIVLARYEGERNASEEEG